MSALPGAVLWAELIEGLDQNHQLLERVLTSLEKFMDRLPLLQHANFSAVFSVHMELLQLLIKGKVEFRSDGMDSTSPVASFMSQELVQVINFISVDLSFTSAPKLPIFHHT